MIDSIKTTVRNSIVKALTFQAQIILKRYNPSIITVSGSVGKTSTKDAIYTALSSTLFIRKNEKSFNSEIGTPLTILGLPNGWNSIVRWAVILIRGAWMVWVSPYADRIARHIHWFDFLKSRPYPHWLLLEVGADKPGDITQLTSWLRPHIVVVTRIPDISAHIEFFDSKEALIAEDAAMIKVLAPDGFLVLNADDNNVLALRLGATGSQKTLTYGFSERADVRCLSYEIMYEENRPIGMNITLALPSTIQDSQQKTSDNMTTASLKLKGVLGRQHIYPILAALAVSVGRHDDIAQSISSFDKYSAPKGRMNSIEGLNGSTLLDDTYNSSPVAVEEALEVLRKIKEEKKVRCIALLGDMMELGQYSIAEHARIGEYAASIVDILVTVGIRSKGTAGAAVARRASLGLPPLVVLEARNAGEAVELLKKYTKEHPTISGTAFDAHDIILVKGSQSVRMERAVMSLMAHPEDAKKLLVRQEREWLVR